MYLQKPVIASNCVPIKNILEETGAGITYISDRTDQLVSILNHLETYDKITMGMQGKYWIERKYNWDQDSEILTQLYQSFVNSST